MHAFSNQRMHAGKLSLTVHATIIQILLYELMYIASWLLVLLCGFSGKINIITCMLRT